MVSGGHWSIIPGVHGGDVLTEVSSGTVVWITAGQDHHLDHDSIISDHHSSSYLGIIISRQLSKDVNESVQHGKGPSVQFLGVVHGDLSYIVPGGDQHQVLVNTGGHESCDPITARDNPPQQKPSVHDQLQVLVTSYQCFEHQ